MTKFTTNKKKKKKKRKKKKKDHVRWGHITIGQGIASYKVCDLEQATQHLSDTFFISKILI